MKRKYQVIIFGAGPAGSVLAYQLATKGIRVMVLERAVFPRYKCCAGGLTVKAAKLLDMNMDGLVDDIISGAIVSFAGNDYYYGDSSGPIMYTVMREKFDYALMKRAQEAGADVVQGVEARAIRISDMGVEILSSVGELASEFVAGADGARSQVAKVMRVTSHEAQIVGIEAEVRVCNKDLSRWESHIGIDIGRIRGGYGWVFPKIGHLSIGIACPHDRAKGLKHIFNEYLDSLRFEPYTIVRWAGRLLPVCVGEPVLARGRAILLGDAAGLADPLTGEGLYNAILSAKLGAASIEKALTCGRVALDDYSDSVATTIIPQMKAAHTFSKILFQLPINLLKLLNQDERVWRACCNLLRGEMNYVMIKNRVSSLGGIYNLIMHAAR